MAIKKNRGGFSAVWGSYPGVFLPNGVMVPFLLDVAIGTSTQARDPSAT